MDDPEAIERARRSALALKEEGNELFKKGKYGAAIERYTEALTLFPRMAVLLVNRAQAHSKRNDWENVLKDCEKAVLIDSSNFKAKYLIGRALMARGDLDGSLGHLTKAMDLAREKGDVIKDQIWRTICRVKYDRWVIESTARQKEQQELKSRLTQLLRDAHQAELASMADRPEEAWERHTEQLAALERVFEAAAKQDRPTEAANEFTCRLTMEPFREPVLSPSGLSYEQSALMEHFQKVGGFDPVTRQPMNASMTIPNAALRSATQAYLDEHPWAYAEMLDGLDS